MKKGSTPRGREGLGTMLNLNCGLAAEEAHHGFAAKPSSAMTSQITNMTPKIINNFLFSISGRLPDTAVFCKWLLKLAGGGGRNMPFRACQAGGSCYVPPPDL